MTSYFKSSNLVPFLSLYNRICQIPFDRDCDQLQLETVKNSTSQGWKKKGICIQGSFGYLIIVFASQTETDFMVLYSPEYKLERAMQVSARTTNPKQRQSIKLEVRSKLKNELLYNFFKKITILISPGIVFWSPPAPCDKFHIFLSASFLCSTIMFS